MLKIRPIVYSKETKQLQDALDFFYSSLEEIQKVLLPLRFYALTLGGIVLGLITSVLLKWSPFVILGVLVLYSLSHLERINFERLIKIQEYKMLFLRAKHAFLGDLSYESWVIEDRSLRSEKEKTQPGARQITRGILTTMQISIVIIAIIATAPSFSSPTALWVSLHTIPTIWIATGDVITVIWSGIILYKTHKVLTPKKESELIVKRFLVWVEDTHSGSCYLASVKKEELNAAITEYLKTNGTGRTRMNKKELLKDKSMIPYTGKPDVLSIEMPYQVVPFIV